METPDPVDIEREKRIGTLPFPDHSDMRGFSYRAPTNTEGYNDFHGNVYPLPKTTPKRKSWWSLFKQFLGIRSERGRKWRPLSPDWVAMITEGQKEPPPDKEEGDPNWERRIRETERKKVSNFPG